MSARVPMAAWLLSASLTLSCIPEDDRPEPAKVLVEVDLPPELRAAQTAPNAISFQTEDGWTVTLDRLLVSMGELEVVVDANCAGYSDAWYFRLLALTQPGAQRLGQLWALDDCRLDYSAAIPDQDAVLGAGVSEQDRDFMRTAIVPVSSEKGPTHAQGMALQIRGGAVKDQVSVKFDWGFSDRLDWTECQRVVDGEVEPRVHLASGETRVLDIAIDPRNLFQTKATQLMQHIADADQTQGNANGSVALDELSRVQVGEQSLAEVMRHTGYPSMFLYGGGSECKLNEGPDI